MKPMTAKTMTTREAAWLAGIIDGEGSIFFHWGGRNKTAKCWVMSVANTDRRMLEACQDYAGCGSIISKTVRVDHYKPQWVWKISSKQNLLSVLQQLREHLVVKGEQADKFLNFMRDQRV